MILRDEHPWCTVRSKIGLIDRYVRLGGVTLECSVAIVMEYARPNWGARSIGVRIDDADEACHQYIPLIGYPSGVIDGIVGEGIELARCNGLRCALYMGSSRPLPLYDPDSDPEAFPRPSTR